MATTPCPTDTQLMPAALEEPAPADLQAHLDHCPECRRRVGRLRVEIQALREAPSMTRDLGPSDLSAVRRAGGRRGGVVVGAIRPGWPGPEGGGEGNGDHFGGRRRAR